MTNPTTYKYIIAGGGTGGHIFPVAIADALKQHQPIAKYYLLGKG